MWGRISGLPVFLLPISFSLKVHWWCSARSDLNYYLIVGAATRILFVSAALFVVQAALLGGLRWFCRNAAFGRDQRFLQQCSQLLLASHNVLRLVAVFLRLNYNLSLAGHVACGGSAESTPHTRRQPIGDWRPAQGGFAIDFVDVLAARSTAARKGPLQLLVRYFPVIIDSQVGHITETLHSLQRPSRRNVRFLDGHCVRARGGSSIDVAALVDRALATVPHF